MKHVLIAGAVSAGLMLTMVTAANAGHARYHHEHELFEVSELTPRSYKTCEATKTADTTSWTQMPSRSVAECGGSSSRARAAATSGRLRQAVALSAAVVSRSCQSNV
jgi:hypothetical protein